MIGRSFILTSVLLSILTMRLPHCIGPAPSVISAVLKRVSNGPGRLYGSIPITRIGMGLIRVRFARFRALRRGARGPQTNWERPSFYHAYVADQQRFLDGLRKAGLPE